MRNRLITLTFCAAVSLVMTVQCQPVSADSSWTDAVTGATSATEALKRLPAGTDLGSDFILSIDSGGGSPAVPGSGPPPGHGGFLQPQDTPANHQPLDWLTSHYRLKSDVYGSVAALGPITMTVITPPASTTEIQQKVTLANALKLFVGSMTPSEWKALAGDGLERNDLTDAQQALFTDYICRNYDVVGGTVQDPHGKGYIQINSQWAFFPNIRHLKSDDIGSAIRFHAVMAPVITVHSRNNGASYSIPDDNEWGDVPYCDYRATPMARVDNPETMVTDPLADVVTDVDTQIKPSDLSFKLPALACRIHLQADTTVGQLVAAIAAASHTELYVDPRYSDRKLYVAGNLAKTAVAADVLQALDFSLCSTWRKVGPAYVMTDDTVGLGTRCHEVASLVRSWNNEIAKKIAAADANLSTEAIAEGVPYTSDPLSLKADTVAQLLTASLPTAIAQLPSAVQTALMQRLADIATVDTGTGKLANTGSPQTVDTSWTVTVQPGVRLSVEIPSLGTVALQDVVASAPISASGLGATAAANAGPDILTASNAADARAAVDKEIEAGQIRLYFSAFKDGATYYQSSACPPASADNGAVLSAALDEAKSNKARIFAVVQLMRWRAPGDTASTGTTALDRTIDGRSPDDTLATSTDDLKIEAGGDWVSPADPRVKTELAGVLKELAAMPGIAGIVLTDVTPPGYYGANSPFDPNVVSLGYNDTMRLQYLRHSHIDPVDIDSSVDDNPMLSSSMRSVMLNVPTFAPSTATQQSDWQDYRASVHAAFVAEVVAPIHKVTPDLPIMIERWPGGPLVRWDQD